MNFKAIRDALIIGKMKAIPDLKRQPLILVVIGILSAIPLFFFAISKPPMKVGFQVTFGKRILFAGPLPSQPWIDENRMTQYVISIEHA